MHSQQISQLSLDSNPLVTTRSAILAVRRFAETGENLAATKLVAEISILLRLPQTAIATAQTIFTRFYCLPNASQYPIKDVVLASVFLAAKVEECARNIKDIVNVYFAIQIFNASPNKQDACFTDIPYDTYNEYKDAIINTEIAILARLGFNVNVQHPHGFMVNYLQSLGLASIEKKEFAQFCWNCLNDMTEIMVYFQPNVIACAVIYYAAKKYKLALPVVPPWWELFDATLEDIEILCQHLNALYLKDKQ
ncbi:hypothetical protein HK100_000084 [Physocladia obscura]|uniref:Cyclin-like domain-containing protein n=1 Tax=Physocladia obscura TaxID=109957 RepID=A0AAD5T9J5_9FUNG|nr:hypothetical protein HK100_000084 [Physocladia obscura]